MSPEIDLWQTAPDPLSIVPSSLHLWRVSVDTLLPHRPTLQKLLSSDEVERANRLINADKRDYFIVTRACLRTILAQYLKIGPEAISFTCNQHGKPFLAPPYSNVFFNLSHSGNQAAVLVSTEKLSGVDIEWIDPGVKYHAVADQIFSAIEKQCLSSYAQIRQRRGFYRIWTTKEARLKAQGTGFSQGDEIVDSDSANWFQTCFPLRNQYVCSVAVSADIKQIKRYCFHFENCLL